MSGGTQTGTRPRDSEPYALTIMPHSPVAKGQDSRHILPFGFTSKVHHNKLSSQKSLGYFATFYLLPLEPCYLSHLSQKILGEQMWLGI